MMYRYVIHAYFMRSNISDIVIIIYQNDISILTDKK